MVDRSQGEIAAEAEMEWYIDNVQGRDEEEKDKMHNRPDCPKCRMLRKKLIIALDVLRFLGSDGDSKLAHETVEKIRSM